MNYAGLNPCDIANGPGVRVSLFVSGCRNACPGCFNKEAWDFNYGQKFTEETFDELEEALVKPQVAGLSILGGDPMEPENRAAVLAICQLVALYYPKKSVWMWTGRLWEDVKGLPVLRYIDVLVDGPFVEELKDLRLPYAGSSNQRVIDVQKSLREGSVVLWKAP